MTDENPYAQFTPDERDSIRSQLDATLKSGKLNQSQMQGVQKAISQLDLIPKLPSETATTGPLGRFIGSFGEQVNPLPTAEALLTQPTTTATELGFQLFSNPVNFLTQMATAPITKTVEQAREGDIAGAAGTATGAILPFLVGGGKPSLRVAAKSRLNPVQAAAVRFAEQERVPLSAGTKTGSQFLQGMEAGIKHLPGPSGVAEKAASETEEAMARLTQGIGARVEPTGAPTPIMAGEKLRGNLEHRINKYDSTADMAYGRLRDIANQNRSNVQLGTQRVQSPILNAQGQPITHTVPVTANLAGPVDMRGVKGMAQDLVDRIEGSFTTNLGDTEKATLQAALKQQSPGYAVLKQITDGPDFMSVEMADRNLSEIKRLARNKREAPAVQAALRNQSQGLMAKATGDLETQVETATAKLGTEATKWRNAGRIATRRKYELKDTLREFSEEPVRAFDKITANEDRSINLLKEVKTNSPESISDIARATVEAIVAKATDKQGIFRGRGALAEWNRIGKGTKAILFGKNADKLENMFQLGDMIKMDANPSGSARVGAGLAALNALVEAPIKTTAKLLGAKQLAKAMYSGNTEYVLRMPKALGKIGVGVQALNVPIERTLLPSIGEGQ